MQVAARAGWAARGGAGGSCGERTRCVTCRALSGEASCGRAGGTCLRVPQCITTPSTAVSHVRLSMQNRVVWLEGEPAYAKIWLRSPGGQVGWLLAGAQGLPTSSSSSPPPSSGQDRNRRVCLPLGPRPLVARCEPRRALRPTTPRRSLRRTWTAAAWPAAASRSERGRAGA
jgi:hypothetical protein